MRIAIIPARGGSKRIPRKNIKIFMGKPMIAWSIEAAIKSECFNRIIVSTDDAEIASAAKLYGAEVPFIRPSNIAQDLSTDLEVFEHFINYLKEHNEILPDIILHLRPTYPNRNLKLLNTCIETFKNNIHNYDSFRTVCAFDKLPQKMYYIENNTLTPYYKEYNGMKEPYNMPRQLFETSYIHNGCIDLIKTETITNLNSMSGNKIFPFIMNDIDDIDNIEDLEKSKKNYKKY